MLLLVFAFCCWTVVSLSDAREVRIPAYTARGLRKPVLRVVPPQSVIIRVRNPAQLSPQLEISKPKVSSVTRIQPVLLHDQVLRPKDGDLLRRLADMGLHKMASLVDSARLEAYLQNSGQVTLFAPTDEAFSLSASPTEALPLRNYILQHVVKGKVTPKDVRNDVTVPSLRSTGTPLRFNIYDDGQMVSVSGSQFLEGGGGSGTVWVQPIDRVIQSVSPEGMVSEVRLTFPKMHELIQRASLMPQLSSGTFTLFSPTNDAFEALKPEIKEQLMDNPTLLRRVLLNHVVPGTYYGAVLGDGQVLKTLGGDAIRFSTRRGLILANGVPVVKGDLSVSNGVIHAINRFLLPPELRPPRRPQATLSPPFGTKIPPKDADRFKDITETYTEPASNPPLSLLKTMTSPLTMPDGRKVTFSTANRLFRRSLLLNRLRRSNGDRVFTIVLPSDGAFIALGPGALDRLRRNSRILRQLLLCHMIEGSLDPSQFSQDKPLNTLGGPVLTSSLNGGRVLMIGGARVLSVRRALNGQVLVTDRVSFPPPNKNVLHAFGAFSIWRHIVEQVPKARDALSSGEAAFTVFAPSDDALSNLPKDVLLDSRLLADLVWSHVVPGAYFRRSMTNGLRLTTVQGNSLTVYVIPGGFSVNNIPISGDEIVAGNGVVHPLNSLLYSPSTNSSVVLPNDLESIGKQFHCMQFLQWMRQANLYNRVAQQARTGSGCTLFLPTDHALNSMSPILRSATLSDPNKLRRFVLFHIVPSTFQPSLARDNDLLPTLLPRKRIRCNVYEPKTQVITASGCPVTEVVPSTDNVTVAVVNGTMTPAVGDIPLVASKAPLLRNFSKILTVAQVQDLLSDDGPYTIFAPSACAISSLPPEDYQKLITNRKLARDFILRYVVRGCYYTSGLFHGQVLTTLAGTELHIAVTPECILVSGVKMKFGDMDATNGVLHVIASVL